MLDSLRAGFPLILFHISCIWVLCRTQLEVRKSTHLNWLVHNFWGKSLEAELHRTLIKVWQQKLAVAHKYLECVCWQLCQEQGTDVHLVGLVLQNNLVSQQPGMVLSRNLRRKNSSTVWTAAWSSPSRLPVCNDSWLYTGWYNMEPVFSHRSPVCPPCPQRLVQLSSWCRSGPRRCQASPRCWWAVQPSWVRNVQGMPESSFCVSSEDLKLDCEAGKASALPRESSFQVLHRNSSFTKGCRWHLSEVHKAKP